MIGPGCRAPDPRNAKRLEERGMVIEHPRSRVLYGAVLTADGRVPLTVGAECVIMEQAVLRARAATH